MLCPSRCMNCYWRLTTGTNHGMDRHGFQLLHETETSISSPSSSWTSYFAIIVTILEFSSHLCSFYHHQYIQQSIRTRKIQMCWCKQRLHDNGCCLRCIHSNLLTKITMVMIMITKIRIVVIMIKINSNKSNNNNNCNGVTLPCKSHYYSVYSQDRLQSLTFWTSVIAAVIAVHIIPRKSVADSQGVNAVFVFEVVWLIFCPISKVDRLVICPLKSPFCC